MTSSLPFPVHDFETVLKNLKSNPQTLTFLRELLIIIDCQCVQISGCLDVAKASLLLTKSPYYKCGSIQLGFPVISVIQASRWKSTCEDPIRDVPNFVMTYNSIHRVIPSI